MLKLFFLPFCFILFFTGCSYKYSEKNVTISQSKVSTIQSASLQKQLEQQNNTPTLNDTFYSFYNEWKGVKYKFGGNSKKGIDCSAFIQKAYKKLDINIPRTTALQSKVGKQIRKNQLEIGDLVFFRTGKNSRHVGIYLENGRFMHASTSKGVIISKLSNVYFNKHYWKAQRIIY